MIISEIIPEGAVQVFGRSKGKVVRKYRCTSGQKKGRIVAKPQTCSNPIRVSSRISMKKAKARRAPLIKIKSRYTKRMSPTSRRLTRLNKTRLKPTKRTTKRRRMK